MNVTTSAAAVFGALATFIGSESCRPEHVRSDAMTNNQKHIAAIAGVDSAGRTHLIFSSKPDEQTLAEMRRAAARPVPSTRAELESDVQRLFPVIVPQSYADLGMPAVLETLPGEGLAVTFALLDATTMTYLTKDEARRFDEEGLKWQQAAIMNLANAPGGAATHSKNAPDGRLQWVAMMHKDGLGSSRTLLTRGWRYTFPEGYWVALPDRSCGMVISKSLSPAELAEVKTSIEKMYEGATTPMSPRLYEQDDLAIPTEWWPRQAPSK